jgi:Mrp family chromosome partitioning ATPase
MLCLVESAPMDDQKTKFRVPEPAWLNSRARNAARRPLFIGLSAAIVVILAGLSLVLAPKNRRAMGPTPAVSDIRIDTLELQSALARSHARVTSAESALVVVRREVATYNAEPVDSVSPQILAKHDSLANILNELSSLMGKAETVPLPSSYRALAASPALATNPRVRALLDSLSEVERQRDAFGGAGGADPMFVALTSQATDIGHAIESIGAQRRDSLRAQIDRIVTPTQQIAKARAAAPDTMPWIAERDSARSAVLVATTELDDARSALELQRQEKQRAKEITAISASPFAMIIAAAIFGIVLGFGGALQMELRRPTVSDAREAERVTGARVMASVVPAADGGEFDRRKADRLAPGYLDPKSDSYQLAYLHVEQSAASPDVVTVLGDDPDVCAIVTMNIAAIAAEDARSVLVIDAAGRGDAIRSLLPFSASADLADLIGGVASWADATAHVAVGRDRTIDVVTGTRSATPSGLIELVQRERQQIGRHYDSVFIIAALDLVPVIAETAFVEGTVLTATAGKTRLSTLVEATARLRENRRQLFGVVLWDAPPPRLTERPRRTLGGKRKAPPPRVTAPHPAAG